MKRLMQTLTLILAVGAVVQTLVVAVEQAQDTKHETEAHTGAKDEVSSAKVKDGSVADKTEPGI